jgi:hypothetical protein
MPKERNQNPTVNDNLNLRLFTYNSNQRKNVERVEKVEIYFLDKYEINESNPDGRRLVETIGEENIVHVDDPLGGQYLITLNLEDQVYTIGKYIDVWSVVFEVNEQAGNVVNEFKIIPDLWYASDMPIVHDFSFGFRPNRIRKGERRWLCVDAIPNVPNISDLQRYYMNLSIASPIKIWIEKSCGECVPKEKDLRMIIEGESVQHRHGSEGHYFIDTEGLDMDCGIYNVWFEMEFGENKYISDNMQLQIY